MSKIVKPLVQTVFTVAGAALGTLLLGPGLGTALGAAVGSAVGSGVTSAAGLNPKVPKTSLAGLDRLTATLVPSAPRKMAFGTTAFATDLRYVEPSGTNQEYIDYIIHVASHRVASIDEIWFEDRQAWTSGGGVQSFYSGYLTVSTILEGGASAYHVVNGGAKWGAAQRLTGCASVHIRIKRTGNGKKAESPLVNGLPGRMTIVGDGMPLYHPAFDSTVPGGSGSMRIDDQSTWAFDVGGYEIGNNHALQALAAHIGWRINGRVSVGFGMPPERLDLATFATAAAACDEPVSLAAGGTQRRYEGGGLFSDFDDPRTVQQSFADATSGWFDDSTGKLGFFVSVNDLAGVLPEFDESDVQGNANWKPFADSPINVVRGRNPEPSAPALFQPTDYVEAALASIDGIDRPLSLDLSLVQEKRRAQRIAKMALERQQYQGTFRATFGIRAWQLHRGQPIRFSFATLGWSNLLFRVASWKVNADATVDMVLRMEDEAIYAWDADETPAVTAADPVKYDPLNAPLILAAAEAGETATWDGISDVAIVAEDFVPDQGVDRTAIKNGELITSTDAAQSGSVTILLSDVTLCQTAPLDMESADLVDIDVAVTVTGTLGGPNNYITLERSINGGAWTALREMANYAGGGAGSSVGTYALTLRDRGHGAGSLAYRLVAGGTGSMSYAYTVTAGSLDVLRIFVK